MNDVTPRQAQALMARGVVLVDVRSMQERAREYIPGSQHIPLPDLEAGGLTSPAPNGVIFYSQSGNGTQLSAALISACVRGACSCPADLYVLEGGLDAWKREGFAVHAEPTTWASRCRAVRCIRNVFKSRERRSQA